jgi:hypothetical protein
VPVLGAVIAERLCRGWRLGLRDDAGARLGAVIAEGLCRGWRVGLRDDAGARLGAVIAEGLGAVIAGEGARCRCWVR